MNKHRIRWLTVVQGLLATALIAIALPRQDARPSPRIDVFIHATNQATADQLLKDLDKELKKASKKSDKRNQELTLITNGPGSFTITSISFLSDTNEADAFIATIAALAKPSLTSGSVSIHHCPEDGDVDYLDWTGCMDDSRASYRIVRFP
jgi:hypothetical protein